MVLHSETEPLQLKKKKKRYLHFFIPTIVHFWYFFVKCMIVMKVEYMVPIRAFQTTQTTQLEDEHIFH